jgi:hypothetical protein
MMIIVTPTARRPGHYDARLEDGCVIVRGSRQPFLDAARALIKRDADPSIILEMFHDGATHHALRAKLAHAAKLAVEDRIRGGKPPRFVPYRALNRAAVGARTAPKRQRVGRNPNRYRRAEK